MTWDADPRVEADGRFDVDETTTADGLQTLLDGIGVIRPRLTAGETGRSILLGRTLYSAGCAGMPPGEIVPAGRWTERERAHGPDPSLLPYRGELGVGLPDDEPPVIGVHMYAVRCIHPSWDPYPYPPDADRRLYVRETTIGWTLPLPRRCVVVWRMAAHGSYVELAVRHAGMFHHDISRWGDLYDAHRPVDENRLDRIIRRDETILRRLIDGGKVTP